MTSKTSKGLMTTGPIAKQLILFSIPLLIGNLFQQLYNTVDSIIVGNFVGSEALAAVGASTPLINLLIGFFMGIATGAGVIISRHFGAQQKEELQDAVHTSIAFAALFGLVLTVIGLVMAPMLLHWIGTPQDVFAPADSYLRIYFAGILAVLLYNMGAGILRAVGDSRRPLYYLCVASVLNIILDLVFVLVFHMGVDGVAWATLISQAVSAFLTLLTLLKTSQSYKLIPSKIRIHKEMLLRIVRLGIPTGLQQMIISLSNVLVWSYINSFGSAAMAGISSANKFDNFLSLPTQSFGLAVTTFVGQNVGARKLKRTQQGVRICLGLSIATVVLIGIPAFVFAEDCIRIFSSDPQVIRYGAGMVRTLVPCYTFLSFSQVLSGAVRGAGITTVPMIILVLNMCVGRQLFLMISMGISHSISMIYLCYPITWFGSGLCMLIYYKKGGWIRRNFKPEELEAMTE